MYNGRYARDGDSWAHLELPYSIIPALRDGTWTFTDSSGSNPDMTYQTSGFIGEYPPNVEDWQYAKDGIDRVQLHLSICCGGK